MAPMAVFDSLQAMTKILVVAKLLLLRRPSMIFFGQTEALNHAEGVGFLQTKALIWKVLFLKTTRICNYHVDATCHCT